MIKMLIGAIWGILLVVSIITARKKDDNDILGVFGVIVCALAFIAWLIALIFMAWNI